MASGSLRQNTVWNLAGLGTYSVSQWALLAAIAQSDAEKAGLLAVGLGIATPVFLLLGLNLSVVQAVEDEPNFYSHLAIRVATFLPGLLISVGIAAAIFGRASVPVVIACSVARWTEVLSTSAQGVFLAKGQLRPLGIGMAFRGLAGAAIAFMIWRSTSSVSLSALGLAIGWAIGVVALEYPAARRLFDADPTVDRAEIGRLVRRGLPLGLDSGANSMTHQGPRILIAGIEGQAALGRYVPVVQLAQYATVVAGSVGAALLSQLAEHWRSGRVDRFRALVRKVLLWSVPAAVAIALVTGFFGPWAVESVLDKDFVDRPLIWSMGVLVGVITVQRLLARALQAVGSFGTVLKIDLAVMAVSLLAAAAGIPAFGLVGATIGMLCGFTIGSMAVVVQLRRLTADRTLGSPTHKERSGG